MTHPSDARFGYDLLCALRTLNFCGSGQNGYDMVVDAAARLLVMLWGFSPIDIDRFSDLYVDDTRKGQMPEPKQFLPRLVSGVRSDPAAIERLIVQMACIACLCEKVEIALPIAKQLADDLDLRPSEGKVYLERGRDLAIALNYIVEMALDASAKRP